jgi:DNA helicase-2/ATP-dependent DNA helicase PcrA
LVDEYQDTNYIQDEIIRKIVLQNPERNIMAVGDDAQSIYAFRGANFQNILNFEKNYKKCKRYTITYNYRSVPQILDLANNCIEHNKNQFKKSMRATRPSGVKPYQVNLGDNKDQARFIANQILQLRQDGYKLNEMAILVRAGFHTLRIELELKAKNIPYEVRAGVAFFEKAHIKDMLAHLRVIENPYDEISWSRIFSIISGIGDVSGSKIFDAISKTDDPIISVSSDTFIAKQLKGSRILKDGVKNLISHSKHLIGYTIDDAPTEVIKKLIKALEDHIKAKYDNWQDRIEDLHQLGIYAQNYPTTQKFLEYLSLNASAIESRTSGMGSPNEEEKPVVLSTIHRAKGLEWRVVFIPMLCEDFFPSSRVVGDAEAYEEERRVFYVATTRTKDELYLISPALIESYRGPQTVRVSKFVEELKPKVYKRSTVRYKPISSKKSNSKKGDSSFFTTADKLGKKE